MVHSSFPPGSPFPQASPSRAAPAPYVPASTLREVAAFARRKGRCLGFLTDYEGRRLLAEMGVTLEEALRGL